MLDTSTFLRGRKKVVLAGLNVGWSNLDEPQSAPYELGGRAESLKNTELGRQRGIEARRAKAAGRAKDPAPVIEAIRAEGITSATGIAKALNERGIPSARGGKWQAAQVLRLGRA
jgi:hypothetical protein